MHINKLTRPIRASILKVQKALGSGLPESVYEAALTHAFIKSGVHVKSQLGLPVIYEDVLPEWGLRIEHPGRRCRYY